MTWKWIRHRVLRPSHTGGRDRYTCGDYAITWVGATHGVWTVLHKGRQIRVAALLTDAKREAERHAAGGPGGS